MSSSAMLNQRGLTIAIAIFGFVLNAYVAANYVEPVNEVAHVSFAAAATGNVTAAAAPAATFFNWNLALGTVVVAIGGILCAGGGLGGGGVYIPVFILILGLSPHYAIPLSKITIFGVSVGSYVINYKKRHTNPKVDRPMIDYDTALVLEPTTLIGTIIGVVMNVTFPAYLLVVFLIVLLSGVTYRTYQKSLRLRIEENAADQEENQPLQMDESKEPAVYSEVVPSDMVPTDASEIEELKRVESRIPWVKAAVLMLAEIGMLVLALFRGGTNIAHPSLLGVHCGSGSYLVIVFAMVVLPVLVLSVFAFKLNRKYEAKTAMGWEFVRGDVHWTRKRTVAYPLIAIIAGVAAGFLGIGGGMVKGPLMLEMGLIPQVATTTSSFMIMYTSSCTSMQFLILGRLKINYAIWYWIVGFFSAIVGQLGLGYFVRKYKKQWMVSFILATGIAVCVVALAGMEIGQLVSHASSTAFIPFCHNTPVAVPAGH